MSLATSFGVKTGGAPFRFICKCCICFILLSPNQPDYTPYAIRPTSILSIEKPPSGQTVVSLMISTRHVPQLCHMPLLIAVNLVKGSHHISPGLLQHLIKAPSPPSVASGKPDSYAFLPQNLWQVLERSVHLGDVGLPEQQEGTVRDIGVGQDCRRL